MTVTYVKFDVIRKNTIESISNKGVVHQICSLMRDIV